MTTFKDSQGETWTMNIFPDLRNRTPLQKAADWFGERITGNELPEVVRAWERALLNFIPNPKLRESVQNVMAREEAYQTALLDAAEKKALEEIESRKLLLPDGQNGRSGALPENSVSTPAPTPTGPFT